MDAIPESERKNEAEEDVKRVQIQGGGFDQFEGVNESALFVINEKEADKEMRRVERMLKKMKDRGQEILKKNRFSNRSELMMP